MQVCGEQGLPISVRVVRAGAPAPYSCSSWPVYLTSGDFQVLKAMTPVVTMVALFLFGLETPTHRLVAAVVIVSIGTAISTYGELRMSWCALIWAPGAWPTQGPRLLDLVPSANWLGASLDINSRSGQCNCRCTPLDLPWLHTP